LSIPPGSKIKVSFVNAVFDRATMFPKNLKRRF
jgi:hypothetical protein